MFGSKIRSWMENHIVRPRKKGNKNKNGTSNSGASNGTHNGHKAATGFTIYHGDGTTSTLTQSSSATASGQNSGISSPARRREVSPIQNHTTSRVGWQSPTEESAMSPKSEHYLYAHHPSVKSHTLSAISSSQTATTLLTNSSNHKDNSNNKKTKTLSPTTNNMFRKSSSSAAAEHPKPSSQSQANSVYRSSGGTNDIHFQNNNSQQNYLNNQQEARRYQNGGSCGGAPRQAYNNLDEPTRYGKILPSKLDGGNNPNDKVNANVQFATTTTNSNEKIASNNNNGPVVYHQTRTGYDGCNRNMIRTNRINGNTVMGPAGGGVSGGGGGGSHPVGHVIGSLSSPESAYSTGYSTDGTSPGATYTPPEYYINMRTGTHYFPKSVNTLAIEAQRYKFGLNKIEEMSPQDPLPNNNHRRTESFDISHNKIPGFGIPDPSFFQSQQLSSSPLPQRNSIVIPTLKGFESPSPRQRCRIRTNPWYSTTETSSSGNTNATTATAETPQFLGKKIEPDASSSSSGIKSSSDADKNGKIEKSSDESDTSSSSTEVENVQRTFSPNTIRRKRADLSSVRSENISHSLLHGAESDEDATLNEMMGKFDESYVYEKETDILSSDSDPTDVVSDLDTGQDAGDECDTDDLLDIDFIDTASIQEVIDKKDLYKNRGSCSYFTIQLENCLTRNRRSRKFSEDSGLPKRKKRLMKTRKKSVESKDKTMSPVRNSRGSRSVGGTPVCLRRNQSADSRKNCHMSPLSNRSNSLTFTEVHAIRGRFVAIAESEKALLKADLEADVKYRQLIHEAETILISMKTSALSIPRETPVASPRRICNPPANKRVEILRNCETDIKRELLKQQKSLEAMDAEHVVHKRLVTTASVPSSPKISNRCSPRKTHITNFMNQNGPPEVPPRRSSVPETPPPPPRSPQLQLNGRTMKSPSASPLTRRRFRSQSPKVPIYSDSDSEEDHSQHSRTRKSRQSLRRSKESVGGNRNGCQPEVEKITLYNESDYTNSNVIAAKKPSLMSFKSVDISNVGSMNTYCPQSEPLKRKVYKGSSSFERIKKSLDMESEIPKQAILDKINNLRRERALKSSNPDMNLSISSLRHEPYNDDDASVSSNLSTKQLLILSTIEDLKRSLEYQSVELNGLNCDDDCSQ